MRFGVTVGNMNGFNDESGPNACIDVAQAAEDLGFDSVWTNDHIVVPTQIESRYPYNDLGEFPAPSTIQCFDPLVVMCALAEATQSVEIAPRAAWSCRCRWGRTGTRARRVQESARGYPAPRGPPP